MKPKPKTPGRNFGLNTTKLKVLRSVLFLLAFIPLVILFLLPVKFISMPFLQASVISSFESDELDSALNTTGKLEFFNWFESYLVPFNKGTAMLKRGDFEQANIYLAEAYQKWEQASDLNQPPHAQCKILNNWSLAIAGAAESLPADQKAQELNRALELLAPCLSGGAAADSNEDQETTNSNGEKIESERQEALGNSDQSTEDQEQKNNASEEESSERGDEDGQSESQNKPEQSDDSQSKEDQLNQKNGSRPGGAGEAGEGGSSDEEQTKPW